MAKKKDSTEYFKRLLNQIAGEIDEEHELIPEYCITGVGDLWCYDPTGRKMVKLSRGTKIYILVFNYDYKGRHLDLVKSGKHYCSLS